MSRIVDRIRADAALRGETMGQAVRHHLATGIAARLGHTLHAGSFVLRGGLLTRAWIAPHRRPTLDLDYVGDFAFDLGETVRRFTPALSCTLDDEIEIADQLTANGMWLDSGFPGVRLGLRLGIGRADQELTIDVGFGDPLVPAATVIRLPHTDIEVRACRPETQLGWKLHGLAEMGPSWRPKDLADLWRITAYVALDAQDLALAIDAAFSSRGYTLADAIGVLRDDRWASKTARVRWGDQPTLPELPQVLADVRAKLAPALAVLASRSSPAKELR